ncbi:hypothetical protein BH23ACT6_BH23ACT6_27880 [soil metagenome]
MSYSVKNMVYSMVAVLALVFAVWAITPNPPDSQRRPAEIESTASFAAAQADWPVWTPAGLEPEWVGSFVRYAAFDGTPTWRLGMISPQTEFLQLRQAVDPGATWEEVSLDGLTQQSTASFEGPDGEQEWAVWTGVDDNDVPQVAVVLAPDRSQPATTIINGTADTAEVAEFIASLEVAAQPEG